MHSQNWDDLRFVLAVAEEGSVSAAARRLRVNHATVLRRVAAFEGRVGLQLFERTASGYVVPPDHRRVIDAAREAAAAIGAVERVAQGVEMRLTGRLCVTSTDTFCQTVLPGIVRDLAVEGEGLTVELSCTNAHLDLSRMEADITVRPAVRLPEGLIGEQAGILGLGAYGPAAASTEGWLGLRGPLERSRMAEVMDRQQPGPLRAAADSFVILREMVAEGLGNAILPKVLAAQDPRLVPLDRPEMQMDIPIWVASHADIGGSSRLRAFRARIKAGLQDRAGRLGPGAPP
ncbi:LysR family transcriptional regulator [Salibaculum sp.]|uniref:LysR family transcriptional regulator n=1 Tax=Salibaculum sp. TaxID=2855480 RepID=UPI002B468AFB|nr:LysR family transcriptional regulator [Salibaculum sp.]HKL70581.1 LysR family transcriptional regulator [Salibaculum sp.]